MFGPLDSRWFKWWISHSLESQSSGVVTIQSKFQSCTPRAFESHHLSLSKDIEILIVIILRLIVLVLRHKASCDTCKTAVSLSTCSVSPAASALFLGATSKSCTVHVMVQAHGFMKVWTTISSWFSWQVQDILAFFLISGSVWGGGAGLGARLWMQLVMRPWCDALNWNCFNWLLTVWGDSETSVLRVCKYYIAL